MRRPGADRPHAARPRRSWLYLGAILAVPILLLPLLIFPFSNDQALYFLSGQKILQGAIHYRDILDLKPPLIYHLYALAVALFGPSVHAVRIFDILVQSCTAWLMMSMIRRASGDSLWAGLAGIFYTLLYVGQGYACTATAESFSGIFAIAMLWLLLNRRTWPGLFAAGICAGFLFLLKFTLGIVLLGALLGEGLSFGVRGARLLRHATALATGFGVTAALLLLYLAASGAFGDFLLMNRFISSYSRIQWKSISVGVKNMLQLVPVRFTDNYSMLFFLSTVIGIGATLQRPEREDGASIDPSRVLLRLCTIDLVLLLLTVILEGKYSAFQFSRLYPLSVPLAAYGALWGIRRIGRMRPLDGYGRIAAALAALALLIFSPLNRYVWHSGAAVTALVRGTAALDAYYNNQGRGYSLDEIERVGRFLDSARRPGERIFIASREAPMVYLAAKEIPEYRVLHSAFIVAPFAPQQWRDSTRSYLLTRHPSFIVVQRGDTMPDVTDSYGTSAGTIHAMRGVDDMLGGDYSLTLRTNAYDVFERRRSPIPAR